MILYIMLRERKSKNILFKGPVPGMSGYRGVAYGRTGDIRNDSHYGIRLVLLRKEVFPYGTLFQKWLEN